ARRARAARTRPCGNNLGNFHRKDAKNAKKSRKMADEILQCAEPVFVASIGYPDIERHGPFFLLPGFPLRFSASLR
ncbi:MAG TPA: hypothetical protein VGR01_08850, partial [Burkholderiales bacterium]|nr:hypothetical protein [Burkholderiales bacterium]